MATEVAVGHAIKTLEAQWPEFSPDEAEVVMSVFLDGQRHGQVTDEELDEAINFYIDKGKFKPRRAASQRRTHCDPVGSIRPPAQRVCGAVDPRRGGD
jgi:hypothetical protein